MKLILFIQIIVLSLLSQTSIARSPVPQSMNFLIKSCETTGENCHQLSYYAAREKITKYQERYFYNKGCNFLQMPSCYYLGEFLINNDIKKDAWYPLAQACFTNDNVACHTLRDNKMTIPFFMSPKQNWGPNWYDDFTEIDNPIIKNQQEFFTCYQYRKFDKGELYLEIEIKNGVVESIKNVKNSLSSELSKCFIRKLKKVVFPKNVTMDLKRYFNYSRIYTKGHF